MQARRPVKATELLSAELSDSTGVMVPSGILNHGRDSLLARLLFSRPAKLRTGRRCLLFLRIDARSQRVHQIDNARRRYPPRWRDLFASLSLLEQINEGVLISILEMRRIEVARLVANDVTCKIKHVLGEL